MKHTAAQPMLALLRRLTRQPEKSDAQCDAGMHWLLCWLAVPLQQPGTKLTAAVAIQGGAGSGKSLLAQVMVDIYGDHGAIVGSEEAHGVFNEWLSNRRFVAVEAEHSHRSLIAKREQIKAWITSPEITINRKYHPALKEENKANFIFLSGSAVQWELVDTQRRFFVIEPESQEAQPAFFREIHHWIDCEGGAEAFRQYLLEYPVTDFSFGAQRTRQKGGAA